MMVRYLIDTNVISEHIRALPNASVIAWWNGISAEQICTTVLNTAELKKGILKLDTQNLKRQKLTQWFENTVLPWFEEKILPITFEVTEKWAELIVNYPRTPEIDALIAATCLHHGCILVTRNEKDFKCIEGLTVLNPFQ